jgi:uridylate kinase
MLLDISIQKRRDPRVVLGRRSARRESGEHMTDASRSARPRWRRVVVKLSGEALMGGLSHGLDAPTLRRIAADLTNAAALGVEVAVVVGGGNFFRGIAGAETGIERARADSIGMLATVMNALALEYAIEKRGHPARALSAVPMPSVCEAYSRQTALHHLAKRRIVVLAGGTGNPFFTTDTGAALRAAELSCDVILKATQVDGVYSADPKRDPTAVRYDRLTHDEAIAGNLAVMDTAAFALARENRIPILVFSIKEPGAISATLEGRGRATLVEPGPQ